MRMSAYYSYYISFNYSNPTNQKMNEQQATQAIKNITFGIEIECMFPLDIARQHNIVTTASNWSNPIWMNHIEHEGESLEFWGASWDQTITRRQGYTPIEFNSKILRGEEGWKQIKLFFTWLASVGAKVDRSCGLHIHLGFKEMARGLDVDEAIEVLLRTLKFGNCAKTALYAQGGSAHRYFHSNYARARFDRRASEVTASHGAVPTLGGKFYFINTTNIADGGINGRKATIEFRAFAGTTNYLKVFNHLATALTIAYTGRVIKRSSWEGANQTADKGLKAFNALASYMSRSQFLRQFPTFEENKRKMWKIGRKMATKFQNTARRWSARGEINLELYK